MGPEFVVLKQGKMGCMVFNKDHQEGLKINGFKANEIDPTGAGDSFDGAFIIGYLAGWELEKTARFANAVGALKVEYFGPMPETTYKEVLNFMENAL